MLLGQVLYKFVVRNPQHVIVNRTNNALGNRQAQFEGVLHGGLLISNNAGYFANMDTVFLERFDAIRFGRRIFYKSM